MEVTEQARRELIELGTHKHILAVARQVYPTWIAAHGNMRAMTVEDLAREIGQCVAVFRNVINVEGEADRRYIIGPGFIVVRGPGIDGFSVAVLAGEVFDLRLEFESPETSVLAGRTT